MADVLNHNSDTILVVSGVKHPVTGSYLNDGTAAFTVFEALTAEQVSAWNTEARVDVATLTAITGGEDLSMSYVSASNGQYYGTLTKTVADAELELGAYHPVRVTVAKAGATTTCTRLYRVDYNRGENAP